MGFFYVSNWTVLTYPKDTEAWEIPLDGNLQHITDTMAPEDLLVDPEDIGTFPPQTQYGDTLWNVQIDPSGATDWYLHQLNNDTTSATWYVESRFHTSNEWHTAPDNNVLSIACYGDSLTSGFANDGTGYLSSEGWPSIWNTLNAGVAAELGLTGANRLAAAVPTLTGYDAIVFLGGANELVFSNILFAPDFQTLVMLPMLAAIHNMVNTVRAASIPLVLCVTPPLHPETGPVLAAVTQIREYFRANFEVPGVTIADIALGWEDGHLYQSDGLHPDADGNLVISRVIVAGINEALG